jgi:hypothetical protein
MKPKPLHLAPQEHELLHALAKAPSMRKSPVPLSSTQRLRFELLGLIEDRADGVCLTERGRALAAEPLEVPPSTHNDSADADRDAPRDSRGRRLGLRRRSPF